MKNKVWLLMAVLLLASAMVGGALVAPQPVAAFTKSWRAECTGVSGSQRGLWDDMPGVGLDGNNNEAGLFWLVTDDAGNERCSYWSDFAALSTNAYPMLRVKAAVSDGALFKVEVFERGRSEFCESQVATVAWTSSQDDGAFRTQEINLPSGHDLCMVKMTLDDDPNSAAQGKAKALIDYIWIWNGNTRGIGWSESFAGGNP